MGVFNCGHQLESEQTICHTALSASSHFNLSQFSSAPRFPPCAMCPVNYKNLAACLSSSRGDVHWVGLDGHPSEPSD